MVPDGQRGERVALSFDEAGKQVLADYTAANVGEQVAVTVDTSVVSAPRIQEVIGDGEATITGQFTEEQARALASTLANRPLPVELTAESSDTETVVVERGWTALRIGLLAGGLILVLAVIAVVGYLISATRQRQPRL